MALSLNKIYERPYVNQDGRKPVKYRNDEETSSTNKSQKEQEFGGNTRSRGLEYTEQKVSTHAPAYEQKFSVPPQNAYVNVNLNNQAYYAPNYTTQTVSADVQPQGINNRINIAQIIKDFRNTAIAIGTPDELNEIVNGYLNVVEKQVQQDKVNPKIIKTTLKSASTILDNYISETLNKESKVVENWVDALFLQEIDFHYDEENINEKFLVKFPDGTTSQTKHQEAIEIEAEQEQIPVEVIKNENVEPLPVKDSSGKTVIPQDKQLKSLFIQAKRYAYADDPENAIKLFEQALNRALDIDDTETSGKIYYEVGKIYDDHDYVAQALKSYNQSIKLSTDENVKTKAHYSMAQIYDDVNQISPAMDHYFSTISHAGVIENIPAQSASLTKIGNIYTDMYDKEAFDYYETALGLASQTDNYNLNGFVESNTARAHVKFREPEKALKAYSKAVKNYVDADSPLKTAQNYVAAADIMVEFNSLNKAYNLLTKAQKYVRQTDDINLMNEINTKINQIKDIVA